MRKSLPLALMLTTFGLVQAQGAPRPTYDPKSPEIVEARAKAKSQSDAWTVEAEALTSAHLFKELERLEAAHQAKLALDPSKYLFGSEDSVKSITIARVLAKRGEHDPVAAFFDGAYQWTVCVSFQKMAAEQWRSSVKECWQGVLSTFKRASEAGIGDASYNIARQYEIGFGVTSSKLVASEWYVKAAEQYNTQRDRENALTSIERALELVPDQPAALRLRNAMLKQSRRIRPTTEQRNLSEATHSSIRFSLEGSIAL